MGATGNMTYKKNNFDDYEENENYETEDDFEETETDEFEDKEDSVLENQFFSDDEFDDDNLEEVNNFVDNGMSEEEDEFDDDDTEDETIPIDIQPFYDKDNPADFVQIMEDYHSGKKYKEEAACEKALVALEGLVRHIVRTKYARYSNRYFEDLLQQGRLGIFKGMESYDPTKSKPATYFYYYILHEMQEWINSMVNKTTSHYDSSVRKIKKAIEKYTRENRSYTAIDIAIDTGLPMQTVEHSLGLINSGESSMEGLESLSSLAAEEKSPEQIYLDEERIRVLDAAILQCLTEEEAHIIELTYGIHGYQMLPIKMISKEMDMPTDRIRKYQATARAKLRQNKALRDFNTDMLRDIIIEIDEENAVPLMIDFDMDAALEIMKDVEIDF